METTRPPPLAHACSDFAFSSFRHFVILFGLPVAGKEAMLVELYRQGRISHGEVAESLGLSRYETDGVLKRHNVTEDLLASGELDEQVAGLRKLV